ncbi:MAG: hypothetical protein JSU61_05695 [Fidelibacterota bacterium]|nr:MAG: hypothetical protein JSU61_05695 [Candidatus Neomarinimicrobiota bacterium]
MTGFRLYRFIALLISGIWLAGCIPYVYNSDDPHFAGYHRSSKADAVTASIVDRETLVPNIITYYQPEEIPVVPTDTAAEPVDLNYSYQDWNRDRYRGDSGTQFNLIYHLNGPYYYHGFQTRFWHNYHRRFHRIPWYANGWYFDDLWWDYAFWGPMYDWHGWMYNPWYGSFYDPWYGFYDPWYYDPYWSYGHHYSYYRGYGYPGYHSWYGYQGTSRVRAKATEARPRGRRDLPTGYVPGMTSAPTYSGGMTKAVVSGTGESQTSGSSSGSAGRAQSQDSGSSGKIKGRQARPRGRQGIFSRSSSSSSSSGSSSKATSSSTKSSSDSGKSKSSDSARPRGRKP